jgi:hypothetical protein
VIFEVLVASSGFSWRDLLFGVNQETKSRVIVLQNDPSTTVENNSTREFHFRLFTRTDHRWNFNFLPHLIFIILLQLLNHQNEFFRFTQPLSSNFIPLNIHDLLISDNQLWHTTLRFSILSHMKQGPPVP